MTTEVPTEAATSPAGSTTGRRRRLTAILAVAGALAAAGGIVTLVPRYELRSVGTAVMAPTVEPGERTLVDRAASGGAGVRRGDVVLVDSDGWINEPPGLVFTVRVVAVAGDDVSCCSADGRLLSNGHPIDEPYAHGDTAAFGPFMITVPAGRVFVLGDARSVSVDSRRHLDIAGGTVPVSAIRGRVVAVASPLWRIRPLAAPAGFPDAWTTGRFPAYLLGIAAIGIGLVLWLVAARRPLYRGARRLAAKIPLGRRRRSW